MQDIAQWIHQEERDPFDSFQEAVEWLCGKWDGDGPLEFVTQLMIVPGYTVRSAQRLLTNFHMPNSTLLCIVEAMIGPGWRTAYAHAVAAEYRFLSYGDACRLKCSVRALQQTGVDEWRALQPPRGQLPWRMSTTSAFSWMALDSRTGAPLVDGRLRK